MKREELVRLAQVAIREEIVRQHRDDERAKCAAGSAFYEEEGAPYQIAQAALTAILEGLREVTPEMLEAGWIAFKKVQNTRMVDMTESSMSASFKAALSTLDDRSTGMGGEG